MPLVPVQYLPAGGLVGRESELTHLRATESGITSVIGPPGIGKTALVACALAAEEAAVLVPVHEATDLHTLLERLFLALHPGLSAEAPELDSELIASQLRARGIESLGLDGVERLAGCPDALHAVERWSQQLRRVFVTSRHRPGLHAERLLELSPLATDPGGTARALFRQHAERHRASALNEENADALIAEIVEVLDGFPLAIELAAARLRLMTLRQLSERLREPDADTPSKRLASLLDASWESVSPRGRELSMLLSRFRNGVPLITLEAMQSLRDGPTEALEPVVAELRDHSLVAFGEGRIHTYRCVRDDVRARERAEGSTRVRDRAFLVMIAAWAEETTRALWQTGQARWLRELTAEQLNLEAGLELALARGGFVPEARSLYVALSAIRRCGRDMTAYRRLVRQFGELDADDSEDEGEALTRVARASLELELGDRERGRALLDGLEEHPSALVRGQAATLGAGMAGNEADLAEVKRAAARGELAYGQLGWEAPAQFLEVLIANAEFWSGRRAEAKTRYQRAVARLEDLDADRLAAIATANVCLTATLTGELDRADRMGERALEAFRRTGECKSEGVVLGYLGMNALNRGDLTSALERFQRVGEKNLLAGFRDQEGMRLCNLACCLLRLGREEEALDALRRSDAIAEALGDRRLLGHNRGLRVQRLVIAHRLEDACEQLDRALNDAALSPSHRTLFRIEREVLRRLADSTARREDLEALVEEAQGLDPESAVSCEQ